jgi:hypothetical protein
MGYLNLGRMRHGGVRAGQMRLRRSKSSMLLATPPPFASSDDPAGPATAARAAPTTPALTPGDSLSRFITGARPLRRARPDTAAGRVRLASRYIQDAMDGVLSKGQARTGSCARCAFLAHVALHYVWLALAWALVALTFFETPLWCLIATEDEALRGGRAEGGSRGGRGNSNGIGNTSSAINNVTSTGPVPTPQAPQAPRAPLPLNPCLDVHYHTFGLPYLDRWAACSLETALVAGLILHAGLQVRVLSLSIWDVYHYVQCTWF